MPYVNKSIPPNLLGGYLLWLLFLKFFGLGAVYTGLFGRAVAVFVVVVLLDEPQLYGSAFVVVLFAQVAFEVALVAPVEELGV